MCVPSGTKCFFVRPGEGCTFSGCSVAILMVLFEVGVSRCRRDVWVEGVEGALMFA